MLFVELTTTKRLFKPSIKLSFTIVFMQYQLTLHVATRVNLMNNLGELLANGKYYLYRTNVVWRLPAAS